MVMVMSDAKPRETHVLERGNYTMRRDKVEIVDVPSFLPCPAGRCAAQPARPGALAGRRRSSRSPPG